VEAFLAERRGLLDSFDKAKRSTAEDSVRTAHGTVAENLIRLWLSSFLPKRFAVTKGYMITTNLEYQGPLEDWDILVYDALEAPILFHREGEGESRRAIPIECVRGVIEVKAALNPEGAERAAEKLARLKNFIGQSQSIEYPEFLCPPFVCGAIFFETDVKSLREYRRALDRLAVLSYSEPALQFMGALILRSQVQNAHSGYLHALISETPIEWADRFEMSSPFQYPDGRFGAFGCLAYCVNNFQRYIFDLLMCIKGAKKTNTASSFYGLDFENVIGSRLFH